MTGLQLLYAVVNFLVLLGGLYFILRKGVGKMLSDRRDKKAEEIARAEEAEKQAEYLAENIETATLENKKQQTEIIQNARELAEQNAKTALEFSEREAKQIVENASRGEKLLREGMQERVCTETIKKAANLSKDILRHDAFEPSRQILTDVFVDKIQYQMKAMPSDILHLSELKKLDISVVSPRPLSSEQMQTITQNIGETFISFSNLADDGVREGVSIKVGDTVYDGELACVLDRLSRDVEENTARFKGELRSTGDGSYGARQKGGC
ncbi:MAG: F0F1 ATP synthase subunit delta [Oscillospiraceae bacterium]